MPRARKPGKRYPNGRLKVDRSASARAESAREAQRVVLERRCREMGLKLKIDASGAYIGSETHANLAKAKNADAGTPWGKLFLAGQITDQAKQGCAEFVALRGAFHRAIHAPKETPSGAALDHIPGGANAVEDVDKVRAIEARYRLVQETIRDRIGPYALKALIDISTRPEDQPTDPHWVEKGGHAAWILLVDGLPKST